MYFCIRNLNLIYVVCLLERDKLRNFGVLNVLTWNGNISHNYVTLPTLRSIEVEQQ